MSRIRRDCTVLRFVSGNCCACGGRIDEAHVPDGPRPQLYGPCCCPACAPLPSAAEVTSAEAATC